MAAKWRIFLHSKCFLTKKGCVKTKKAEKETILLKKYPTQKTLKKPIREKLTHSSSPENSQRYSYTNPLYHYHYTANKQGHCLDHNKQKTKLFHSF